MKDINIVIEGVEYRAVSTSSSEVKEGVTCDVYEIPDNLSFDLGVVSVKKGCSTPLQLVLNGDTTIERYISGVGMLVIDTGKSTEKKYLFSQSSHQRDILVEVGQTMQWHATEELIFHELCKPPFSEGRFKNL